MLQTCVAAGAGVDAPVGADAGMPGLTLDAATAVDGPPRVDIIANMISPPMTIAPAMMVSSRRLNPAFRAGAAAADEDTRGATAGDDTAAVGGVAAETFGEE